MSNEERKNKMTEEKIINNTPSEAVKAAQGEKAETDNKMNAENAKNEIRANNGPTAAPCKVDYLPDTLQRDGLFCCWKYELKDERYTKVPIDPRTGKNGDSSDKRKFAGLPTAEQYQTHFQGVGIGLGIFENKTGANIAAIDIDNCRKDDGTMTEFALYVVDMMDKCYTEISPSGHGIRLLFTVPSGLKYDTKKYYIRNPHEEIEVYLPGMTNRFVTLTGDTVFPGKDLEDRGEQLRKVIENCMERPKAAQNTQPVNVDPLNMSDSDLLERIQGSNDQKTKDLLSGNWGLYSEYPTPSEADLGLCIKLAYWTHGDPAQMERLFNTSPLADRDKWKTRENYRRDTITRAIEKNGNNFYDPNYYKKQDLEELKEAARKEEAQETAHTVDNLEPPEDKAPEGTATASQKEPEPDALDKFLKEIYTRRYEPIPTGIKEIDDLLNGGVIPQTLVILSGAAAQGKTALTCEMFENFAKSGRKCIYLNLEMSREQLFARSISKLIYKQRGLKFSSVYILQGYRQSPEDRERVEDAVEKYREEIYPNLKYNPDGIGNSLTEILEYMEKLGQAAQKKKEPGPIFAVDYLHLLQGDPKEDPVEMIKRAVAGFKSYAVKYNTVVFAISAQNRQANESRAASMSGARDTSAVEYSADYLLQLKDGSDQEKQNDILRLYAVKNRFGRSDQDEGTPLKFLAGQSCFESPKHWEITQDNKKGRI